MRMASPTLEGRSKLPVQDFLSYFRFQTKTSIKVQIIIMIIIIIIIIWTLMLVFVWNRKYDFISGLCKLLQITITLQLQMVRAPIQLKLFGLLYDTWMEALAGSPSGCKRRTADWCKSCHSEAWTEKWIMSVKINVNWYWPAQLENRSPSSSHYQVSNPIIWSDQKGAGVTFDLTFFDNSKVATFDW